MQLEYLSKQKNKYTLTSHYIKFNLLTNGLNLSRQGPVPRFLRYQVIHGCVQQVAEHFEAEAFEIASRQNYVRYMYMKIDSNIFLFLITML